MKLTFTVNGKDRAVEVPPQKRLLDILRDAGFEVVPLNLSEFEKCDGALTCLSILV